MYPIVEIDLKKLEANTKVITGMCRDVGVDVAGVIKVCNGMLECASVMAKSGCTYIASSRLAQLEDVKAAGIDLPLMLIRIPMPTETPQLVRTADISLNSDIAVLRALNMEAGKIGVVHKVVLMIELGDLREGVWTDEEILAIAKEVERDLPNLHLLGVGTNLGCYGSIDPTAEKLSELVDKAELIEAAIGRKLEMISGGGSTSFPRVIEGDMPERINNLRIGESILINKDSFELYGYDIPGTYRDVFLLKAEVVESRLKPSHPIGEIAFDAFRNKPTYVDRGNRRRAILGVGKVDYGYLDQLKLRDEKAELLGASSDHTLLDIEDSDKPYNVGDIVEIELNYVSTVFTTGSNSVQRVFV